MAEDSETKHGGSNGKKDGLSGSSFFTWFMVIALLGVWTSVAVVWFDLVNYEDVLAKAKDFRYNLSEVLQGKLGAYDADGDGDFDIEDAKVLLGLKDRVVSEKASEDSETDSEAASEYITDQDLEDALNDESDMPYEDLTDQDLEDALNDAYESEVAYEDVSDLEEALDDHEEIEEEIGMEFTLEDAVKPSVHESLHAEHEAEEEPENVEPAIEEPVVAEEDVFTEQQPFVPEEVYQVDEVQQEATKDEQVEEEPEDLVESEEELVLEVAESYFDIPISEVEEEETIYSEPFAVEEPEDEINPPVFEEEERAPEPPAEEAPEVEEAHAEEIHVATELDHNQNEAEDSQEELEPHEELPEEETVEEDLTEENELPDTESESVEEEEPAEFLAAIPEGTAVPETESIPEALEEPEDLLQDDRPEDTLHEGVPEESFHEHQEGDALHEGISEESLHEHQEEDALHEGISEESLHDHQEKDALHEHALHEETLQEEHVEEQTQTSDHQHEEHAGGKPLPEKKKDQAKKKKPKLLNKFDKTIKAEIDAAEKLRKKGKVEEALRAFETLVVKYPQSPRARYGKAQSEDDLAEKIRSNEILLRAVGTYEEVSTLQNVPSDLAKLALKRRANRQQFLGRMRGSLLTLQKLVQLYPDDISLKNDLGVGYLLLGDNNKAKEVYEEVLSLDPNNGFAKVHYGFILKADNKIAESIPYLREGLLSEEPGTDDGRFYFHLGDALQRVGDKEAYSWYETGHKKGHFASVWQRSLYNVDGLKAQPWWTAKETGYTDLVRTLEANWKVIRDEGLAVMDETKGLFVPEDENLREKGDWSQYTLWQQGRKNEKSCKDAPRTCALLDRFPESTGCRRGQIKYSVMHPGTHVWPHTGPTNCRLRMHLGLVIPKTGCRIRCANDTRTWEEGKVLIFDDSFEHEVWQDANAYRLIFIVDVWHPELTQHQRRTLPAI